MTIRLSIVTVTLNDVEGLCRTLDSLSNLLRTAQDAVEVLVQDGGSHEFPQSELAARYPTVLFESSRDGGIYEGMNRGIARSHGDMLWFLNGGDICLANDWPELDARVHRKDQSVLLFDFVLDVAGRKISRRARRPLYIYHGLPTSHQAILYPSEPLRTQCYNTKYRVAADYELTARLWSEGMEFVRVGLTLAEFGPGGMSQTNSRRIAEEARLVQATVLHAPVLVQAVSRAGHAVARWRRDRQTGAALQGL